MEPSPPPSCQCFGVLGEAVFFAKSSPTATASPRSPQPWHDGGGEGSMVRVHEPVHFVASKRSSPCRWTPINRLANRCSTTTTVSHTCSRSPATVACRCCRRIGLGNGSSRRWTQRERFTAFHCGAGWPCWNGLRMGGVPLWGQPCSWSVDQTGPTLEDAGRFRSARTVASSREVSMSGSPVKEDEPALRVATASRFERLKVGKFGNLTHDVGPERVLQLARKPGNHFVPRTDFVGEGFHIASLPVVPLIGDVFTIPSDLAKSSCVITLR